MGGVAVTLRCKRWSCEICQPFNRWAVVRRATNGNPNCFITLTVNPAHLASPTERALGLVVAWRTIRRRLLKLDGGKPTPFLAVFEATKNGEPHLHILCRSRWISQRWLSDQMKALMCAPICDVRRIQDSGRAAVYVSKYVGKSPHRFDGTKRFWTSLDWLGPRGERADKPVLAAEVWVKHAMTLDQVARALIAEGFTVQRWPHKLIYSNGPGP